MNELKTSKYVEFMNGLELPEEAIQVFKVWSDQVSAEHLHPNSNRYRATERQAIMQMGIIVGRELEKRGE